MHRDPSCLKALLSDSDSDDDLDMLLEEYEHEESESQNRRYRGSVPGRRVINRNRVEGHNRLYQDYFSENPTYSKEYFRRRFRMRRPLFCRILNGVESYDPILFKEVMHLGFLVYHLFKR